MRANYFYPYMKQLHETNMFNSWCDHLWRQPMFSSALAYLCREIWNRIVWSSSRPWGQSFSVPHQTSFFALKLLHLRPQGLDIIEVWTNSGLTGDRLDAMFCVSLLSYSWVMRRSAFLNQLQHSTSMLAIFFTILNRSSSFVFHVISKR